MRGVGALDLPDEHRGAGRAKVGAANGDAVHAEAVAVGRHQAADLQRAALHARDGGLRVAERGRRLADLA